VGSLVASKPVSTTVSCVPPRTASRVKVNVAASSNRAGEVPSASWLFQR
jgi:hypothetical protein